MQFIEIYLNLNLQFHFIVLSETWGTHDKAKLNIIQGYNHLYDTREQRNGGGISIYVNANIAYKKRTDLKLDKTYFESYFIEVDKTVFQSKHNVIIGGLYKPPNVSIDIFNEKMEILLNKIGKEKKYAYIIGDYNINTLNGPSCKSTKIHDFVNLMSSYSYNKLIRLPTRVIKDSSTLLDNIYSNVLNVYDSGTSGILHKKFRNEVLSNQRRAAKNYYHEQFEIRGSNTKSGWALINFLTGQGDKYSQKKITSL